jgi:hypothetical protein
MIVGRGYEMLSPLCVSGPSQGTSSANHTQQLPIARGPPGGEGEGIAIGGPMHRGDCSPRHSPVVAAGRGFPRRRRWARRLPPR